MRTITFLTITLTFFSCAKKVHKVFEDNSIEALGVTSDIIKDSISFEYGSSSLGKSLGLQYLGCGGFHINYGDKGFLIDPFFSNQSFWSVPFKKIRPKIEDIEFGLSGIAERANIQAMFISHSHYDHLLDAPYISNTYFQEASIYGSRSTVNLLSSVSDTLLLRDISGLAVQIYDDNVGEDNWTMISPNLRVLAIESGHAPHFRFIVPIKFYQGKVYQPIKGFTDPEMPTKASKWKEGATYSFLIDVIEGDKVIFRTYLQSSASQPVEGFPPQSVLDEKSVDLVILGGASYQYIKKREYPTGIIDYLKPEKLLICHWEDFFRPYQEYPKRFVRFTNFKKLIKVLYNQNESLKGSMEIAFLNPKCKIIVTR